MDKRQHKYSNLLQLTWFFLNSVGDAIVFSGDQNINAIGNELDNQLIGNIADNIIDAGAGNDQVVADSGNDTVAYGDGYDTVAGGDGNLNLDDVQSIAPGENGLTMTFVGGTTVTFEGVFSLDGIKVEIDEDGGFAILS